MNALLTDVKYALRMFVRNPGFSLVATLMLAMGIGANATTFSVANALFLKSLPVPHPERLLAVQEAMSVPNFNDIESAQRSFSRMTIFTSTPVALNTGNTADRVDAEVVSAGYFETVGVRTAVGRTFSPEECATKGTHPVVVLSYTAWKTRFGGAPDIVGRTIHVNASPFVVVGVAERGFAGTTPAEAPALWVPMMMCETVMPGYDFLEERGERAFSVLGRLADGVSAEQARQDLDRIARTLAADYPEANVGFKTSLETAGEGKSPLRESLLPVLTLLMAVAGIVLLITCANLANLLLAKASARTREIGIRQALGATRFQIARQRIIESVVLVGVGAAASWFLVIWTCDALLATLAPPNTQMAIDPDANVLAFMAAVAALSVVLCGIGPAVVAPQLDIMRVLRNGAGATPRDTWTRNALIVLQVTLSVVLLTGAALFLKTLAALETIDPGLDASNVLTFRVSPGLTGHSGPEAAHLLEVVRNRVATLPGVQSVAESQLVQLGFGDIRRPVVRAGEASTADQLPVGYNVVSDGYFGTVGTAVLSGREFAQSDVPDAQGVVIVNETLAKRLFWNENPIGKHVQLPLSPEKPGEELEIVGVVRDGKYTSLLEAPTPYFYLPLSQNRRASISFFVRASGTPENFSSAIQSALRSVDPNLPAFSIQPLSRYLDKQTQRQRATAAILSVSGSLALALAAIGLYGALSFTVLRRFREIGVRMALGADRRDVLTMIVRYGMSLAALGVGIGVLVSIWLGSAASSMLFGVDPTDPWALAGVGALILCTSFLAVILPALRATRVDPVVALRCD